MRKLLAATMVMLFAGIAVSGCSSKKGDGGTSDPDHLDETAVYDSVAADQPREVNGSMSQAGIPITGSVVASVLDQATDDSGGALDKADFTLDVTDASGKHVQASLKSMITAAAIGAEGDFQGGVAVNKEINGDSGLGIKEFPKTKAYLAFTGLARIRVDNVSLDGTHFVLAWVSRGIRNNADNTLSSAVDDHDLEFHVAFPGKLANPNFPIPTVADGFLYYYFENVNLKQLTPDQKAAVGAGLSPPEVPNQPPVAVARVLVGGQPANLATLENPPNFLLVQLDASLSSDADGVIQSYAWDVRQYNDTGALEPLNKTKGANVTLNITKAGLKQISLRIIDDKGGIANDTEIIYVDYHFRVSQAFSEFSPAGAGPDCRDALNCQQHFVTVAYGANKIVVKKPVSTGPAGTSCDTPTIDAYLPGGGATAAATAANADLTITDPAKIKVGQYTVKVWWRSQVQCVYTFEAAVTYAPPAAAAS